MRVKAKNKKICFEANNEILGEINHTISSKRVVWKNTSRYCRKTRNYF